MDWTPAALQRLRDLWAEGVPTAEIGRRLGASKNSIVGKAHRLLLPPRPSPIGTRGEANLVRRVKPKQVTLPPLVTPPMPVLPPTLPLVVIPPPVVIAAPVVRPDPAAKPVKRCAWPLWSGNKPTHRYCDAPVTGGDRGSLAACYCAAHAATARRRSHAGEARA